MIQLQHTVTDIAKNSVFEGENLGLTTAVVLNLTKGIENMGHILYTDNFYTSPLLACNIKKLRYWNCRHSAKKTERLPQAIGGCQRQRFT